MIGHYTIPIYRTSMVARTLGKLSVDPKRPAGERSIHRHEAIAIFLSFFCTLGFSLGFKVFGADTGII